MSQEEVMMLMEKYPDKVWSTKEIQDQLNLSHTSVNNNVRRLYIAGLIDRKMDKQFIGYKFYLR